MSCPTAARNLMPGGTGSVTPSMLEGGMADMDLYSSQFRRLAELCRDIRSGRLLGEREAVRVPEIERRKE